MATKSAGAAFDDSAGGRHVHGLFFDPALTCCSASKEADRSIIRDHYYITLR